MDRLKHPVAEFSDAVDTQGTIEDFEDLLEALEKRKQDIDISILRFKEAFERRGGAPYEASQPHEKYVVSETPLLVEVEVFEEEIPVEFANEKIEGRERKEGAMTTEGVSDWHSCTNFVGKRGSCDMIMK